MFINTILDCVHKYTSKIYESSFILQNIDKVIFPLILLTFVVSIFLNSDIIGYFAIATFILTLIRIFITPKDNLKCERFEIFLITYFMLVLVSLAGSTLFMLSLKGFMKTFIYLGFYLSVVHHLKNNRQNIVPILLTIAGCVCFESLIGVSQSFAKVDEISGWQDMSNLNPEEVITRVYGTLLPLNPNLFGGYLILSTPTLFGLCAYFFNKKKHLFSSIFAVFSVIACAVIFLTGCRGAYIALFAIFVSLFIISLKVFWEKFKRLYITISSLMAVICSFVICAVTPLRVRVISIFAMRNDSSNSFRFNVYKSAVQMFKDNWLVGIGQGNQNFREIYGLYMKTGFDALSAYNIYLETSVESGIFALIAFAGFLLSLLADGIRFIKNAPDIEDLIITAIPVLAIIGVMVHGFVDTVFFRPQLQIVFWTMCAILSNKLYSNIKEC